MQKKGATQDDLKGLILPDFRCSLRNLLSSSCSLMFNRYTLQFFNVMLGINSKVWFYLNWFGNFLSIALLKTWLLKFLYSSGISLSISSMLLLLLLILNSSLLYASSSKLTNNIFSPFSIVFSFIFSSIISSFGSLGIYIFLYYCWQLCRLIEESFQSIDRLCFCNQLYPRNRSWFLRFITDS